MGTITNHQAVAKANTMSQVALEEIRVTDSDVEAGIISYSSSQSPLPWIKFKTSKGSKSWRVTYDFDSAMYSVSVTTADQGIPVLKLGSDLAEALCEALRASK